MVDSLTLCGEETFPNILAVRVGFLISSFEPSLLNVGSDKRPTKARFEEKYGPYNTANSEHYQGKQWKLEIRNSEIRDKVSYLAKSRKF